MTRSLSSTNQQEEGDGVATRSPASAEMVIGADHGATNGRGDEVGRRRRRGRRRGRGNGKSTNGEEGKEEEKIDLGNACDTPTEIINTHPGNQFRSNVEFYEKPRQLLVLGAMMLVMTYLGYAHSNPNKCRDTVIIRPHPGVWRVVHGLGMLYLMCMAILLVHDKAGARELVRVFVPDIGPSPGPKSPEAFQDCSLNMKTIYRQLTEIWFVAHTFGWWGKMVMFRDWGVCWLLSIGFEILECSLQFLIPEFKECWWDSLLIDLLGANLLGMAAGWWTLQNIETHVFDWSGSQSQSSNRIRRLVNKLSPYSFTRYRWSMFSSFKRFLQVMALVIITLMMEVNAFMLLHTLQIPKASAFNKIRLTLVALLAIPSAAEYYDFISNPQAVRLGPNAWCMMAVMQLEIVVWLKFWPANFVVTTPPPDVGYPWMCTIMLLALWAFLSLTLVKERDLGSRLSPKSYSQGGNGRRADIGGDTTEMHSSHQYRNGGRSPSKAHRRKGGGGASTEAASPATPIKTPFSWTRKDVTVGVVQEVVDMLFFLSFLPLLWLIRQWAF